MEIEIEMELKKMDDEKGRKMTENWYVCWWYLFTYP